MNRKRVRFQNGTTYLDKRRNIWYYRWSDSEGHRKCATLGTLAELPTKAKAQRVAEVYRMSANAELPNVPRVTFGTAAQKYILERMPQRHTTAGGYRNNLEKYAIPKWGELALAEVKPLAGWFGILPLAQKTKSHVKSAMRQVFEYAMLCELMKAERNPMDFVRVTGATLRDKDPLILTPEQFGTLLECLVAEPARTLVIVAMCLGLRRSELAGLKWSDFDWQKQEVMIQRSVIANRVDVVKTKRSKARLPLDPALTAVLESWRTITDFKAETDWVWASPWKAGAQPYLLNAVQRDYIVPAAKRAGIGQIGWHTFRHTYRTWLDKVGTPLGVQKDLMRHADIKTTMNAYGGPLAETMREANSNIVRMVIQ